jgi:predicted amidophosphoribosyltransferase
MFGCIVCGSFSIRKYSLCSFCFNSLNLDQKRQSQNYFVGSNLIKGYSLFAWVRDKHKVLSKMLITIKGGFRKDILRSLSSDLETLLLINECIHCEIFIVYPQAFKKGHSIPVSDHAFVLARELSKVLNLTLVGLRPCLGEKSQKQRTKLERNSVKFERTLGFSGKTVIFVDDVITTGATLKAAYKALKPKKMIAVAVASRRLS